MATGAVGNRRSALRTYWAVVPLVSIAAIVAADLVTGPQRVFLGFLVAPPLLAATRSRARTVAWIALLSLATALLLGLPSHIWLEPDHLIRLAAVLLCGALSIVIARRRESWERPLHRLKLSFDQAAEAAILTDPDGTIEYVNPAFERITGYRRSEVIGRNPRLLKSGVQDAAFYEKMWSELTAGRVWSGVIENRRSDGSHYVAEGTISPVRDAAGRVINYIGLQMDITERRRLEVQLAQVQRMESIGRLAGAVAHDFNNLLTVIQMNVAAIKRRLPEGDSGRGDLADVEQACGQAGDLTRQLLAFARRQVVQPRPLDLNAILSGTQHMLGRLIGEDIELAIGLAENLGTVRADAGQIEQVLLNLAVNARDAMPAGGKLAIETGNVMLDAGYAASHADVAPGEYVMLAVSDSGHGMSAEVVEHVFEPFFTTKEQGKGTGLGLATCYGIVKQSGGHIAVNSEVGVGTTFRVYLPRSATPR